MSTLSEMRTSSAWHEWVFTTAKPVTIVPCSELPDIAEEVLDWTKKSRLRRQYGYLNTYLCATRFPGVRIVHGYVTTEGEPIESAWNEYRGVHFNVMERRAGVIGYCSVLVMTLDEYGTYLFETFEHTHLVRLGLKKIQNEAYWSSFRDRRRNAPDTTAQWSAWRKSR